MKSIPRLAWLSMLAVVLCGCSEKLTYERFQTISVGDSPQTVEAILGKPWMKSINDQAWVYQNVDRGINAVIYFQDSQVTSKKWGDATHGLQGDSLITTPGESKETHIREIK